MILTIGNTKGGVGKTTLALNIAILRAHQGRDVWLVDGDRQGQAEAAVALRNARGQRPAIACSHYPEGAILRDQVQHQRKKYDDVVIDVGGRDTTALRAALLLTDALLVPFAPESFDTWAFADISALLDEVRAYRNGPRAWAVLNRAEARRRDGVGHERDSRDNQEAVARLDDYPLLHYLDAPIVRRKAISSAASFGLTPREAEQTDAKAVDELDRLVTLLFDTRPAVKCDQAHIRRQ